MTEQRGHQGVTALVTSATSVGRAAAGSSAGTAPTSSCTGATPSAAARWPAPSPPRAARPASPPPTSAPAQLDDLVRQAGASSTTQSRTEPGLRDRRYAPPEARGDGVVVHSVRGVELVYEIQAAAVDDFRHVSPGDVCCCAVRHVVPLSGRCSCPWRRWPTSSEAQRRMRSALSR